MNKNEIRNVRVDRKIAIYIKCKYYYILYNKYTVYKFSTEFQFSNFYKIKKMSINRVKDTFFA